LTKTGRLFAIHGCATTEEISKSLGEYIPLEELHKIELDTAMDTYKYLQKFAVGMEQVVWGHIDNNGAFKNEFSDIELKLRADTDSFISDQLPAVFNNFIILTS
jgi:hypothetical protein